MAGSLFDVDGKVAVVTGGSRGIGRMIARAFVDGGARTYITARTADACRRTAAELSAGGTCLALTADLSTEEGRRHLADELGRQEPAIDVLVNNAGANWHAPLDEHTEAVWDRVVDLNLKALFQVTRLLLPLLRAAGTRDDPARVINIGSIDGLTAAVPDEYAYATSKAAVHHLTRLLAKDLAPEVAVNAVAPGPFASKMTEAMLARYHDEIVAATPLQRIGRPDDMAGVALFLASRAGSYLTGAVIPVDGGLATAT